MIDTVHNVYVQRLVDRYDPFWALDLDRERDERDIREADPVDWWENYIRRDRAYHIGRIRHFLDDHDQPEAIAVECGVPGWNSYQVKVLDGHHRLCAAVIRGDRKIQADCGGWVDMISFLRDRRRKDPWV